MVRQSVQFFALLLTALALIPSGAHLFALPNKIVLPQDDYFIAQSAYRGWMFLGVPLVLAIMADGALAFLVRQQRTAFVFALAAVLLLATTLAVFFLFIQPGNLATANWVFAPENWRDLRARWEYGHAVDAIITLAAFVSITLAVLADRAAA